MSSSKKIIKISFLVSLLLILIIIVIIVFSFRLNVNRYIGDYTETLKTQNLSQNSSQNYQNSSTQTQKSSNSSALSSSSTPIQTSVFNSSKGQNLILLKPVIQKFTACPIQIEGLISGNWFFEAQFAIDVLHNNIKQETILATAKEDWMTAKPVLFTAQYNCKICPIGTTIQLVFRKDNPSGIEAYDDKILVELPSCNY